MKTPNQMSRTAKLVECGLMVALAFVLSFIPIYRFPWGGSVTCFSTLPIILASLRHGTRWGVATALVYGVVQTLQGMDAVAAAGTLAAMVFCALLDYLLAYGCIGFTGAIARRFSSPTKGLIAGITFTGLMRLAFSFLSGMLLWGSYAWEGWPVWAYSLAYNASWCLPDVAIVLVASLLLSRVKIFALLPQRQDA